MSSETKLLLLWEPPAAIGRATGWEFAKQGAKLALLASGMEQLEATKKELESYGVKASMIQCDLADAQQVEAAAEQAEEN